VDNYAGGLYRCDGTIENNLISENGAEGLCHCNGAIRRNTISHNSGGGLRGCNGLILNNVIYRNLDGGMVSCDGVIENNTICDNSAEGTGGLYYCKGIIRNCIIWGNTGSGGDVQVSRSSAPTYSCIQGWSEVGRGNISAYPDFVDPEAADYHLQIPSPCIDAGKNEDWMKDAVDLDGNPRIIHGRSSLTVDMGAYEFGYPSRMLQVRKDDAGGVLLIWNSGPADAHYVIWSCLDLLSGEWTQGNAVPSQGMRTTWSDPDETSRQKFYRIEIIGDM
jgi:hypothetical protein